MNTLLRYDKLQEGGPSDMELTLLPFHEQAVFIVSSGPLERVGRGESGSEKRLRYRPNKQTQIGLACLTKHNL